MKLVSLEGTCSGIALRTHGHHQRSCRIVIGKRLFMIGLCLFAICPGLRNKSGPDLSRLTGRTPSVHDRMNDGASKDDSLGVRTFATWG